MKPTILLCLSCPLTFAQQPPLPAENNGSRDAVFRVTTTLVQVDAVVTDSKRRYVTDLTADDFELFVDGKPQKLTHFSYVRVVPEGNPGSRKPDPKSQLTLAPTPSAPLRPEDVRRTIVLLSDDFGL